MTARADAVERFLERAGWAGAARRPLAGDASFRHYLRLAQGGDTAVLMNAPPPMEDVRPFLHVAAILSSLGLSAPAIIDADVEHGLVLEEDFGDGTYARLLAEGADETALYRLAVDVLVALQERAPAAAVGSLAPYDIARILDELTVLVDWFLPAASGAPTPPALRAEFLDCWRGVLEATPLGAPTLVLRDHHIANLVWLPERPGVAACGLLDFQDAVAGPAAYDLVSLLEDVRRDVPPALQAAMRDHYAASAGITDRAAFDHAYAVLGAQRNCRIAGVFARLDRRDGKPGYLQWLPRVWRLIAGDLAHPALAPVAGWLDRHIPAALRARSLERTAP